MCARTDLWEPRVATPGATRPECAKGKPFRFVGVKRRGKLESASADEANGASLSVSCLATYVKQRYRINAGAK